MTPIQLSEYTPHVHGSDVMLIKSAVTETETGASSRPHLHLIGMDSLNSGYIARAFWTDISSVQSIFVSLLSIDDSGAIDGMATASISIIGHNQHAIN